MNDKIRLKKMVIYLMHSGGWQFKKNKKLSTESEVDAVNKIITYNPTMANPIIIIMTEFINMLYPELKRPQAKGIAKEVFAVFKKEEIDFFMFCLECLPNIQ